MAHESELPSPESSPDFGLHEIKVTIIYEDFASGVRAKHFAGLLANGCHCACCPGESLWGSDLLEFPSFADLAADEAADSDYLIISVSGDYVTPATRQWIEAQLDDIARRHAVLIALVTSGGKVDGGGGAFHEWRAEDGARHRLRDLCAEKDVPFFCHARALPETAATPDFPYEDVPAPRELRSPRGSRFRLPPILQPDIP